MKNKLNSFFIYLISFFSFFFLTAFLINSAFNPQAINNYYGEVLQASYCTHYVDNEASIDGDGSWEKPWDNIAGHVNNLTPGNVMCVRGNPSSPGRIYTEPGISLSADCADGTVENSITIRTYPEEHVVLNSTLESYIVRFQDVRYWQLEGFALDKETNDGYGIVFNNAHFNVIHDCEIYDGGHEAVHLFSGQGNVIEHCKIHNFNAGPSDDAHGILVEAATDTVIQHNEIYDCRGSGVQLWDTGDNSGTIIQDNHIYATPGLERCVEAAVGVKRGNPIIRRNIMHGYHYCDGSCGGTGGGIGVCIAIYMLVDGATIEENLIYDCVSGISISSNDGVVTVAKNVFRDFVTDAESWLNTGLYIHHNPTNVYVNNNTFHQLPNYLWYISDRGNVEFKNNLMYETDNVYESGQASVAADYNGWFSTAQRIEGDHDTLGDNPFLTTDYHLTAGSPARGAGEGGVDLGAFQYSSSPSQSPSPSLSPSSSPSPSTSSSPPPSAPNYDLNDDSQINVSDFLTLIPYWKEDYSSYPEGDFNGDEDINSFDLIDLILHFDGDGSPSPIPSPSSTPLGFVFSINHESGSLDEWDNINNPDGDEINVTSESALNGTSYGMQVDINDTDSVWAYKDFTQITSSGWRVRFYIDPNGVSCNGSFTVLDVRYGGKIIMYIYLNDIVGGDYTLRTRIKDDALVYQWIDDGGTMSDGEHYYEVNVEYVADTDSSNAVVTAYIDGVQVDQEGGIDLYDANRKPSRVYMGATAGVDDGTNGTIYLDELVFRDNNVEIGE